MEGMYWLNGKQNPELPPLQKHSRKTFPSCLWKICIRVKVMQEDLAIFLLTLKYIYKFKRSSCMMGWTTPDDDRDWGFALLGVNMVSSGLRTLVAGLSNLESGDWHPKVLGLKNTDVTFVLWKTDTNMVASWFPAGDLEALKQCWDPAVSEFSTGGVVRRSETLEDGDCLLWIQQAISMLEESHIAITKGIVQSREEFISVTTVSGVLAEQWLTGLRPQHHGGWKGLLQASPLTGGNRESLA